jgi:hypothetical protein
MDHNFIELLIWIIANEITKDKCKAVDHQKVFRKMCDSLSKEYNIRFNNDDALSKSHNKLGKKMIDFYYDHFMEGSDDEVNDGAMKLIEFPLTTGKYGNEFRELYMIGNGGFGNVYRSVNVLDNEEYAIKKVPLYGRVKYIFILL